MRRHRPLLSRDRRRHRGAGWPAGRAGAGTHGRHPEVLEECAGRRAGGPSEPRRRVLAAATGQPRAQAMAGARRVAAACPASTARAPPWARTAGLASWRGARGAGRRLMQGERRGRGEKKEREGLTGGPHSHVASTSAKPHSKPPGWPNVTGFESWMVKAPGFGVGWPKSYSGKSWMAKNGLYSG